MCACAPVSQHLCFYLRAGTAWGGWRRARGRQRSEDAMRGCGKGCGQGCRQGMPMAARLPRSADPMVRRGWRGPGLRNAGRCIWRRRAQQAGDRVLRSDGAAQRLQCPGSAPGLWLPVLPLLCACSGSPCSRCRAPGSSSGSPGSRRSAVSYSSGNATSFPALRVYRLSMQ